MNLRTLQVALALLLAGCTTFESRPPEEAPDGSVDAGALSDAGAATDAALDTQDVPPDAATCVRVTRPAPSDWKWVFVSKVLETGDMQPESLNVHLVMDAKCSDEAKRAGLTTQGTFRAYIMAGSPAVQRLKSAGPWKRPDGSSAFPGKDRFSSAEPTKAGNYGEAKATNFAWQGASDQPCDQFARVYCFEDDL